MEQINQNEVKKFIRMIVIIVVVFIVFYLITILATRHHKKGYTPSSTTPAVIQYDEIILSQLYNQKENEYFVLIKGEEDPYLSLFESLLSQFETKENGFTYYTIDLSSAFNQRFVGEEASFDPNGLRFVETTLLKIQDHTLVEYYETSDGILEYLKSIIA